METCGVQVIPWDISLHMNSTEFLWSFHVFAHVKFPRKIFHGKVSMNFYKVLIWASTGSPHTLLSESELDKRCVNIKICLKMNSCGRRTAVEFVAVVATVVIAVTPSVVGDAATVRTAEPLRTAAYIYTMTPCSASSSSAVIMYYISWCLPHETPVMISDLDITIFHLHINLTK